MNTHAKRSVPKFYMSSVGHVETATSARAPNLRPTNGMMANSEVVSAFHSGSGSGSSSARRTPLTHRYDKAKASTANARDQRRAPEHAASAETSATGRNENNNPDRCPICNKGYIIAKANGHDVRACLDHNIVMPAKD